MAAKLKKGDRVFILAGKDKGKEGEIVQILGSDKAIVQGINLVKKHKKPSQEDEGGIVDQEKPIHKSNLMLIDQKSKKTTIVVTGDFSTLQLKIGYFGGANSDSACKTVYIADWKGLYSPNWFIRAQKRSLIANKGVE